ncbi:hypothetical protein ULO1_05540 [Carboxydocella sp. ULO1]|nr:hypothetical protein ULO1_05540 [Carboxydocella sp. ULO1]
MARCIDCARFPWMPGADYSMLPPMQCAKELTARRWTIESANIEHNCPYYDGPEAVKENDANSGTENKASETARRTNTRRRN